MRADWRRKKNAVLAIDLKHAGNKFDCCYQSPCTRQNVNFAQWVLPDGEESHVCPRLLVTEETNQLLKFHTHYGRGLLPLSGALLDQSAYYFDAMAYIESIENTYGE